MALIASIKYRREILSERGLKSTFLRQRNSVELSTFLREYQLPNVFLDFGNQCVIQRSRLIVLCLNQSKMQPWCLHWFASCEYSVLFDNWIVIDSLQNGKERFLIVRALTFRYGGDNHKPIKAIVIQSCWWKSLHVFMYYGLGIDEGMIDCTLRNLYPRVCVDVLYNLSVDEEKWVLNPRAVNCLDVEK